MQQTSPERRSCNRLARDVRSLSLALKAATEFTGIHFMRIAILYLIFSVNLIAPLYAQTQTSPSPSPPPSSAQSGKGGWLELLIEKNPGLGNIVVSSFLLPVIILIINSHHNYKLKKHESEIGLKKIETEKEIQAKYENTTQKRQYQNIVLSSLVKLLFEVQRLHVELSSKCDDQTCIDKALERFNEAFARYQSLIADNQIYLSHTITNHLYAFYSELSELLIELNDIKSSGQFEIAIVPVYNKAKSLAGEIIAIQKLMLKERGELTDQFEAAHLEKMKNCCGREPSETQLAAYKVLKRRVEELPDAPQVLIGPASQSVTSQS